MNQLGVILIIRLLLDVIGDERDANYMVIDLDDDPEFDAVKVSKINLRQQVINQ